MSDDLVNNHSGVNVAVSVAVLGSIWIETHVVALADDARSKLAVVVMHSEEMRLHVHVCQLVVDIFALCPVKQLLFRFLILGVGSETSLRPLAAVRQFEIG